VPATCKESTASDYQARLDNHVSPVFDDLKVDEITEGKIKEFLFSKVNAGYAGSTISHMKNVISGILNQAVDDDLIATNPALNLGSKFMKKINDAIQARKASNGGESKGEPDPLIVYQQNGGLPDLRYVGEYPYFSMGSLKHYIL
jgi:hypothetical protein